MKGPAQRSVTAVDLLILQPAIRPTLSGVTDHSQGLAQALVRRGLTSHHLDIADPIQRERINLIPHAAVLLQFSPYGYQTRGVPAWVVPWLAEQRRRRPEVPWITYFHEMWAWGVPPYRSAFWLSAWQRRICLDVMAASELAIFNSAWALELGRSHLGDRALLVPTASNVGEPASVPALVNRPPALAVFGSARNRSQCYADTRRLAAFMERAGLDRIIDIGEPMAGTPPVRAGIPIARCGKLPANGVSQALLAARYGIFEAPWGLASKSGVFAAYRAHGVIPVAIRPRPDPAYRGAPGPEFGIDFITLDAADPAIAAGGPDLRDRYGEGGIDRLADVVAAGMKR